ncbi:hypothetical protein HNQ56_000617 [Anaerotaenia torta]|uniref:hypothetical protein n=1 Tax=Anaerotaenia torta TaxID=433293 RepID=UPI003D1F01A4
MRKWISLLMASLLLLLSVSNGSFVYANSKVLIDQEEALNAYEKIISNFKKTKEGDIIYPNEYGGEYIDNDILVIQLVEPSEEVKEKYLAMCEYSNKIRFEEVTYSLMFLNQIHEYGNILRGKYEKIGYGVDRRNNRCFINVTEEDKNKLIEEISYSKNMLPIDVEALDLVLFLPIYTGVHLWMLIQ